MLDRLLHREEQEEEQKESYSIGVQTNAMPGTDVGTQFSEDTLQKREALRRIAHVLANNDKRFKRGKLNSLLDTATDQQHQRTLEVWQAKKSYIEAERNLTPDDVVSVRLHACSAFLRPLIVLCSGKSDQLLASAFHSLQGLIEKDQIAVNKLRKCFAIHTSRLSGIWWDFIKQVKQKTISPDLARYYRTVLLLKKIFASKTTANLRSCLSLLKMKKQLSEARSPKKASPSANMKRQFFAASRITGSFIMTKTANFSEAAAKVLSLVSKQLGETFSIIKHRHRMAVILEKSNVHNFVFRIERMFKGAQKHGLVLIRQAAVAKEEHDTRLLAAVDGLERLIHRAGLVYTTFYSLKTTEAAQGSLF